MSALTQSLDLLPPLLVSVGGIISLLLESSPFSPADKKIRKFISALYFMTVWLAYFVSRLLGKYVFYSPIFTLVTFLLGFIFFIIVLYMALNKSKMRSKTVIYYILGLLFVSMGFTNYLLPQEKIVILFDSVNRLEEVIAHDSQGTPRNLFLHTSYLADGVILDKNEYEDLKDFVIIVESQEQPHTLLKQDIQIETLGFKGGKYVFRF